MITGEKGIYGLTREKGKAGGTKLKTPAEHRGSIARSDPKSTPRRPHQHRAHARTTRNVFLVGAATLLNPTCDKYVQRMICWHHRCFINKRGLRARWRLWKQWFLMRRVSQGRLHKRACNITVFELSLTQDIKHTTLNPKQALL